MTPHLHTWTPIPGECARYRCACDATGYRAGDGSIRAHRVKLQLRQRIEARPTCRSDGRRAAWVPEDYDAGRERDA